MPQCTKESLKELHVLLKTASRTHRTACLPDTSFHYFYQGTKPGFKDERGRGGLQGPNQTPSMPKMRGHLPNSRTVLAACPSNLAALAPGGPRLGSDHRQSLRSARPGIGAEGSGPTAGVSAQPATPGAVPAAARAAANTPPPQPSSPPLGGAEPTGSGAAAARAQEVPPPYVINAARRPGRPGAVGGGRRRPLRWQRLLRWAQWEHATLRCPLRAASKAREPGKGQVTPRTLVSWSRCHLKARLPAIVPAGRIFELWHPVSLRVRSRPQLVTREVSTSIFKEHLPERLNLENTETTKHYIHRIQRDIGYRIRNFGRLKFRSSVPAWKTRWNFPACTNVHISD